MAVPGRISGLLCLALSAVAHGWAEDAPIQDNSFLIEEAYNQERGVVQHIAAFSRARSGDWALSVTQEWPVPGQRHQLSVTVPVSANEVAGNRRSGVGDVALNYRLQLAGDGRARLAVAPRLSLLFPTGSWAARRGAGGAGIQGNLPLSVTLGPRAVVHWNAGVTYTPSARAVNGERASTTAVNAGQGLAFRTGHNLDLMVELFYLGGGEVVAPDETRWRDQLWLNPGLRWALNLRGGVQIVPGIAMPVGLGPSRGDIGVFLYLSVEHPFAKRDP